MNAPILFQLTGLAAIIAGISTLFSYWLTEGRKEKYPFLTWWVYTANPFFMVLAFLGIFLYQADAIGAWGLIGFLSGTAGSIFTTYSSKVSGVNVNQLGRGLIALAILFLAVGTWISGGFPQWVPLLWLASFVLAIPGFLFESLQLLGYVAGGISFSFGLIAAGYLMLFSTNL